MKNVFLNNGFSHLSELVTFDEVENLRLIYDRLLTDKVKTANLRSDLSGVVKDANKTEKITQVMRPSLVEPSLLKNIVYKRALQWAKELLGADMLLDFDMLINKAPYSDTPTPWHQDAAYWIALPDKRAVSCWIALDDVYEENGCMWFIPKENSNVLQHQNLPNGGALYCETSLEYKAQCIPLSAGGCTFHDGFTLHFSKGNTTSSQRRALILNFRPKKMIQLEREQGVDHTGARTARQK